MYLAQTDPQVLVQDELDAIQLHLVDVADDTVGPRGPTAAGDRGLASVQFDADAVDQVSGIGKNFGGAWRVEGGADERRGAEGGREEERKTGREEGLRVGEREQKWSVNLSQGPSGGAEECEKRTANQKNEKSREEDGESSGGLQQRKNKRDTTMSNGTRRGSKRIRSTRQNRKLGNTQTT